MLRLWQIGGDIFKQTLTQLKMIDKVLRNIFIKMLRRTADKFYNFRSMQLSSV